VVLDDADLDRAVPGAAFGRFLHQRANLHVYQPHRG
jgi:acyl-CoA reductase-like NAD-dependent aldehyde dehydrogenase